MSWDQWWNSATPLLVGYSVKIVLVLVLLLVGWILAGWVGMIVRRAIGHTGLDETLARFLGRFARWGILLLVIVVCLNTFGVEATSFAAVIGSAGIAIGLALQGTLSNFAAGMMLLMFRPFNVSDAIQVAGQTGKVNAIGLFTTTLDTFDNRRLVIPNGVVFGSTIENISFHDQRRVEVSVGVAYGADIDQTREVLTQAVETVPGVLETPGPAVVLLDLGESAVNWSIRVWADAAEFGNVKQATVRAVKLALDEANIEIPYPQLSVHTRSSAGTDATSPPT